MHLGIIPDGNRRYASDKDLSKREAYEQSKEVLKNIFEDVDDYPVEIEDVTLYLLSEENLDRGKSELRMLFKLLESHIEPVVEEFGESGFSFNLATTNPSALPSNIVERLESLENRFSEGGKTLNLLISYSGKKDIIKAANSVGSKSVDIESLEDELQVKNDIDFVIRTGRNPSRECISGFALWNASYAEYYHLEKNFPEVEKDDIGKALEHFKKLRRNKGE